MKRRKPLVIIVLIVVLGLITYLAVNYKEIKQTFINGVNDGKAERAKEEGKK
jgi:hypothetical protein